MAFAWLGRTLLGAGSAESAGRVAQPDAALSAGEPVGGALGDATASGAHRATPLRDPGRSPSQAARITPQPLPSAARAAGTSEDPAAAAPARRALLTGTGAGSAERATLEPEAADCVARRGTSPVRGSPRLAAAAARAPAAVAPEGGTDQSGAVGIRRSVEQMRLKYPPLRLPKGFPLGPFETPKRALDEINAHTSNVKTDGGGFAVLWGSSRGGVTTKGWERGQQKKLICHEHVPAHGCKWSLWLEHCEGGWVICKFSGHNDKCGDVHSHALVQSREEANACAAMRSIPDEYLGTAKSMVDAGVRMCDVVRWMTHRVKAAGGVATFNYGDIYRATSASTAERALDATNLVETLRQREQERGLFYRTQTDAEGCLKSVFYAMAGAHELYAVDAKRQVVELDTKARCVSALLSRAAFPRPRRFASRPPLLISSRTAPFLAARHEQRGAEARAVGDSGQYGRHQDPRRQPAAGRDGGVVSVHVRVL